MQGEEDAVWKCGPMCVLQQSSSIPAKKRVVEITRKLTRGTSEKAKELLLLTKGCVEFNTAFIERFNGTVRERLASLTRKCRHAAVRVATLEMGMYLIGCTYNFCIPHQELSKKNAFWTANDSSNGCRFD